MIEKNKKAHTSIALNRSMVSKDSAPESSEGSEEFRKKT